MNINFDVLDEYPRLHLGFDRYFKRVHGSSNILIAQNWIQIAKRRPAIGLFAMTTEEACDYEKRLPFDEIAGYRICDLYLNCLTFETAIWERRFVRVYYREDLKFNVTSPKLPAFRKSVWSAIKDCPDPQHIPNQSAAESYYLRKLPNGFSVEGFNHRFPQYRFHDDIPEHVLQMFRPLLNLSCPVDGYNNLAHPSKTRLMSRAELGALINMEALPTDVWLADIFPLAMSEWISLQCYFCLRGDWGERDWQSRYVKKKWEPCSTNAHRKCFDMIEYVPEYLDTAPKQIPNRHFEVPQ